jgi:hypothetical protein
VWGGLEVQRSKSCVLESEVITVRTHGQSESLDNYNYRHSSTSTTPPACGYTHSLRRWTTARSRLESDKLFMWKEIFVFFCLCLNSFLRKALLQYLDMTLHGLSGICFLKLDLDWKEKNKRVADVNDYFPCSLVVH